MALTVETGSGVVGANSYIDLEFARSYALDRGVTLSSDDAILTGWLIESADYTETFADKYKGVRNTAEQGLSWPRTGALINGFPFSDSSIPSQLKKAQAQGVVELSAGNLLNPSITAYAERRVKVDVIEVEYATGGGINAAATPEITPAYPKIVALLKPLFKFTVGLLPVVRA
jgi:hypothetical protein